MIKRIFIITTLLTLFATSCSLFKEQNTTVTDLQRASEIAVVVKTGVSFAVSGVLTKNPKASPYFKAASLAIKSCVDANTLNPEEVISTVQSFVTVDIKDSTLYPLINAALSAGLDIYKTFYNVNISSGKDINIYLRMVLTAIQQGIDVATVSNIGSDQIKMPFTSNPISILNEKNLKLQ